ncbi:MAG: energy-coupling factor transporter transmembrane protein EcfT [Desulfobacterota bacterium]|nr:energy-coupling factor transporter transmembrane protein EcfT [Thermodesulfobacteriota bacterium]
MIRFSEMIRTAYAQWESASGEGLFQRIDARIKILFLAFFLVLVSLKTEILTEIGIGLFVFLLMLLSRLNVFHLYRKILLFTFVFGFLIALPSAFNLFKPGKILWPLLHLSGPYEIWIYPVPRTIGITEEGLYGLGMMALRVWNSLSLTFLLLYTTPLPEILRALKIFRVPDAFLIVITLTYKYLFLFSKIVEEMHLAKKSRLVREPRAQEARGWVVGRIAFLFRKTRRRAEEVFDAMRSRGFSDRIQIQGMPKLRPRDKAVGILLLLLGCLFLWM